MSRRGETIELAVLGLLHEGPLHGYEIRRRLNLMLGWGLGRVLSYGSLYPALKKMSRGGLISEDDSVPTLVTGRPRIVYRVTDDGRAAFARLMSEAGPSAWEDDDFGIRFTFFASAPTEIRLRVLEGRRTRLEERLARVRADLERSPRKADRYASEFHRHRIESVEREVRWLSDLITAERERHMGREGGGRAAGRPVHHPEQTPERQPEHQGHTGHALPGA
ncbi:PadR family transcriptional regulator [Nocardioides jishulii]|uniref:PadR family transcriptional regulator n=1 Tax=Nocardioides jishulii TaxID=2575440 RepID=A0A4U2YRT9_9ACTN|nr:PadR family transcriptional regulator [Nocardioides jishulii]QCX28981.1 PadR family transcriptional regulator [Nocardioides jishulii]TKI64118.1 PadR family transcriptional regulator [Nocardioides jishulii]